MTYSYWYKVTRHDGKELALFETRHDAAGFSAKCHNCNEYDIQPIIPSVWLSWHPRVNPNTFEPYSVALSTE